MGNDSLPKIMVQKDLIWVSAVKSMINAGLQTLKRDSGGHAKSF